MQCIGGEKMLSLILVVVIVSWIIYRIKGKKNLFPKEFFVDAFSRKPPYDNPPWMLLLLVFVGGFIIVTYAGMTTYIKNYDANVEAITYYQNNITQLESKIAELDTVIEDNESNFELSKEEIKVLKEEREELEIELNDEKVALNRLPLNQSPERLSLYKFLLYFGH